MSVVYLRDAENLQSTIEEIFRKFNHLNFKDKRIFVKPNMLRIAQPDDCVVTNPDLVKVSVKFLKENGADVTVGDNPIPQLVNQIEVGKRCGFFDASDGNFKNIGRYVKRMKIKNRNVKEIYVSIDILECDILISLPKFKTHELTMLSCAVKNQFGIIPGGLKPKLHAQCPDVNSFARLLIDIYKIRPPDLIIVDCLKVRDAKGRLHNLNKIIAGDDGFAVDYVCSLLAGIEPYKNPVLKIALNEGLLKLEKIDIDGEATPFNGFAVPFSFPLRGLLAEIASRLFSRIKGIEVPSITLELCSRCLSCENVCPTRAIKSLMIDYKKCIKCYCCIEVCPNSAINKRWKVL